MTNPVPEVDRRRVRAGLTVVTLVLLVALVLLFVVDATLPRVILGAVVVFTIVRTTLIVRREKGSMTSG
jgi:hypothetical protein